MTDSMFQKSRRGALTLSAISAVTTAMMLTASLPANAAPAASAVSAPSAKDSSRRVIRRAGSAATPAATSTPMAAPSAGADMNAAPSVKTKLYNRGPIRATGIDISDGALPNIPVPRTSVSDVSFLPTVLIAQKTGLGTDKLDVSIIDDFIEEVSPNARHYPPNFPNRSQRYYAREKVKAFAEWIEPYASAPDASYEVLIRAAKLNGFGRNLDLGSDYAVRGGRYVDRAIKAKPNDAEANFLYGMMLSEGGGFKEGQKYLDRAASLGYVEAEQSLAQSDLLSDRRSAALDRLRKLQQENPNNDIIRKQIALIEDGKYYIWDLPAPDIKLKPVS